MSENIFCCHLTVFCPVFCCTHKPCMYMYMYMYVVAMVTVYIILAGKMQSRWW